MELKEKTKTIAVIGALLVSVATTVCRAATDGYEEVRSDHFLIYHKNVNKELIQETIEFAERYYNEIADNLGYRYSQSWTWDNRAKIYVYMDRNDFQEATGQPQWSSGCADYRNKTLWTYVQASGFFDSLLPHELGHIVFRQWINFHDVPLYVDEGIASLQEKSKRFAATQTVRDLITEGRLLNFEQLASMESPHDMDKETAEAFYAESIGMMDYLINTFGRTKFAIMCRKIKEGVSFDEALDNTYYEFKTPKDVFERWLKELGYVIKEKGAVKVIY